MIKFKPMTCELGILPEFFSAWDPRPPQEQINDAYAHCGGWRPFDGFAVSQRPDGKYVIQYPEDPPHKEVSRATLHGWHIVLFPHAWVMVVDPDDMSNHEIARVG